MIKGLDLLAGCTFKSSFAKYSTQYAVGIFAEAFGDAYSTVEAALKKGTLHIRIHLIWSDTHSFGDKDISKIKKLSAKYNKLALKYPNSLVYLSPFCEHNLSNPDKYLDIVKSDAPNCVVVNTPWKGKLSNKYINEVHGDHAKPNGIYLYSFDGTEATNSDVEKYKKKYADAEIFFMWTGRFNLNWSENDKTSRPQRIKEANLRKPSKDMIDSIAYLFSIKGFYSLDKKSLLKSHSEKHNAADTKGDKLLIITPAKVKELILKRNGKVIGKLSYYGSYVDGRYRYYASQFAFKYGHDVEIYAGSKKLGVVDCGFRSAPFR